MLGAKSTGNVPTVASAVPECLPLARLVVFTRGGMKNWNCGSLEWQTLGVRMCLEGPRMAALHVLTDLRRLQRLGKAPHRKPRPL